MLSGEQICMLIEKRFEALQNMGRIFVESILHRLLIKFCNSPYIDQKDYAETIQELQEIFYYFKNESPDTLSGDELIHFMKNSFDSECKGSLEFLRGKLSVKQDKINPAINKSE